MGIFPLSKTKSKTNIKKFLKCKMSSFSLEIFGLFQNVLCLAKKTLSLPYMINLMKHFKIHPF